MVLILNGDLKYRTMNIRSF